MGLQSLGTHDILPAPEDTKDEMSNPWALFALKEVEESKKRSGEAAIGSLPHAPLRPISTNQTTIFSRSKSSPSADLPRTDGVRDWQAFARSKDSKGYTSDNTTSLTRESPVSRSNSVDTSPSSSTKTSQYTLCYALSVPYNDLMPDPPLCFCKKPASCTKTTLGVIYECHDMKYEISGSSAKDIGAYGRRKSISPSQSQVCAFHVHKEAWDRYRERLRNGKPLDETDDELKQCAAFNFTFCTLFRTSNTYPKESPRLPRCFCNRPVKRFQIHQRYDNRAFYTCGNFFECINCCFWFAWAEDTRFVPGRHPIHDLFIEEKPAVEEEKKIEAEPAAKEEKAENETTTAEDTEEQHEEGIPTTVEDEKKDGDKAADVCDEVSVDATKSDAGSQRSKDLEQLEDEHPCDTPLTQPFMTNYDEDMKIYYQSTSSAPSITIPSKQPSPSDYSKADSISSQPDQPNDFLRLLQGANMPAWHKPDEKTADDDNDDRPPGADNDAKSSTVSPSPPASTRSASIISSPIDEEDVNEKIPNDYGVTVTKSPGAQLIPGAVYTRHLLKDAHVCQLSTKAAIEQAERAQEREKEELRRRIQDLEAEVDKLRGAADQGRLAMQQLARTREQLLETRETASFQLQRMESIIKQNKELHVALEEQRQRHVDAAEKLSMTEIYNEDLCEQLQDLREKNRKLADGAAHKDSKCRVCFQGTIEFALVPCYHCGTSFLVIEYALFWISVVLTRISPSILSNLCRKITRMCDLQNSQVCNPKDILELKNASYKKQVRNIFG